MGLNPPVPQPDSNWEIRVAVLLSLLLQIILIFLGPTRKRSASPILRSIVWSCYLLADWVADLGLGLILNNMMAPPDPGLDYAQVMGELDARNKAGEDLAITIAGDGPPLPMEDQPPLETMPELQSAVTVKSLEVCAYEFFLIFRRVLVHVVISFEQRMKSTAFFVEQPDLKPEEALEVMQLELGFMYDMLYTKARTAHTCKGWVLRSICSSCLVSALIIFFLLDKPGHQVRSVDVGITYALLLVGLVLDVAALIMLFLSNRAMVFVQQHSTKRRLAWLARLSQVIMWLRRRWCHSCSWSGVASQMNLIRYCLDQKPGPYNSSSTGGGSGNKLGVGGGACWKKQLWRWLMHMIAKMLRMDEMVDDIQHVKLIFAKEEDQYAAAGRTLEFIFHHLKEQATPNANFNNNIGEVYYHRGNAVLRKHQQETYVALGNNRKKMKVIMESVEDRGLEESLLVWHIATDLCLLYRDGDGYKSLRPDQVEDQMLRMRAMSKVLSEYMLYLLIKQPDMLSATAGIGLRSYRDTCAEARRFFAAAGSTSTSMSTDDAREALLRVNTSENPKRVKGDRSKSVSFDGVILAKVLRELDEGLMWRLVSQVWVEMLTFVAVNGRGSTHVRSLNRGGELVTIVWLLTQHMGLSKMYEIQDEDPLPEFGPRPPPLPLWPVLVVTEEPIYRRHNHI